LIHDQISSDKSNNLCLYTSFHTAVEVIFKLSTTDTHEEVNQEKTLANFDKINFLVIPQNTGIFITKLSYIYLPSGVFLHILTKT
jgi:hypothetical protein